MLVSVGTFLYVTTIHILPEVFMENHSHSHDHELECDTIRERDPEMMTVMNELNKEREADLKCVART
jgi:hypothetical protein